VTTAAVAFEEERRSAADTPAEGATALRVAPAETVAPVNTRLVMTTIVLVQASWLSVLGFFAYKFVA
jgi:hypothetical protein